MYTYPIQNTLYYVNNLIFKCSFSTIGWALWHLYTSEVSPTLLYRRSIYKYRNVEHLHCRQIAMAKPLCLVFVLISVFYSIELVNAKMFVHNPIKFVHQRIFHSIKREILQKRQQSCLPILNDTPPECNVTLLVGNITNTIINNAGALTEDDFAQLDNAYSQICVSKCVSPVLNYYRCLNIPDDFKNYLTNLVQRGVCGKQGNDFCQVLYLRRYSNNIRFINELVDACPIINSTRVDCSSANSTCRQYVLNFTTNLGCCTVPYLGNVSSCNVNVVDPCVSAISGSIIVAPAIVCLILAALLAIFYM